MRNLFGIDPWFDATASQFCCQLLDRSFVLRIVSQEYIPFMFVSLFGERVDGRIVISPLAHKRDCGREAFVECFTVSLNRNLEGFRYIVMVVPARWFYLGWYTANQYSDFRLLAFPTGVVTEKQF